MNHLPASPSHWDHIKAILQLPFIIALVLPLLISFFTQDLTPIHLLPRWFSVIIGLGFLLPGLIFFIKTVQLFDKIGKGTLAPWNPTRQLIIAGPYRYVRNPMIIGVVLILLAQVFLLQSGNILLFTGVFVLFKTLYFIFDEEPTMRKRYGEEYLAYSRYVRRWIPRRKAWNPAKAKSHHRPTYIHSITHLN